MRGNRGRRSQSDRVPRPQTTAGQVSEVKKILFNATPTEKRAALLVNDRVIELVVERPDQFRLVGNIYRGKVVSVLPGIQSAFVDVGLDRSCFLHASDVDPSLLLEQNDALLIERFTNQASKRQRIARVPIEKVLVEGQEIIVQVVKEPISTKGAKVTTQISLAGRFLVLVPDADFIGVSKKNDDDKERRNLKKLIAQFKPRGVGIIVRTIGLEVSEEAFVRELKALVEKWKEVQEGALNIHGPRQIYRELGITTSVIRDLFAPDVTEVHVDSEEDYREILDYLGTASPELCERVKLYTDKIPLFDKFNIEKDLERSLRRKVWLKSGGYILFDNTEALLAVDVNTGRNVGKADVEDTIFRTNIEAAEEIGRQMRLRDLGGQIVIDFIDMAMPEHRRKVEDTMHAILEADPSATSMTGLSKFCLLEITRQRVRPELRELYTDACTACNGLGWVFSPSAVSSRINRWLHRAALQGLTKDLRLSAHPAIALYLTKDNFSVLRRIESEHTVVIEVTEAEGLDQDEFEFFAKGEHKPLKIEAGN